MDISPFQATKYPITNNQYKQFLDESGLECDSIDHKGILKSLFTFQIHNAHGSIPTSQFLCHPLTIGKHKIDQMNHSDQDGNPLMNTIFFVIGMGLLHTQVLKKNMQFLKNSKNAHLNYNFFLILLFVRWTWEKTCDMDFSQRCGNILQLLQHDTSNPLGVAISCPGSN